jgi:Response regulator containing CheY-like receiver domain and AraC-type DNA-binding domain
MYKVLIVDDERLIREGIALTINWQELGLELSGTAQNGVEALKLIDKNQPDIVITDIKMPVMSGLELIDITRQKYPDINYIILSGYGEFELASKAMSYGVKHYILKPCSESKIMEVLKEVIADIKKSQNRDLVLSYDDIINAINTGNVDDALNSLETFLAYIKIASLSKNMAKAYCNELFINIINCGKSTEMEKYLKMVCQINNIEYIYDIQHLFEKIIRCIIQDNQESLFLKQNKIISTITKYISENYMNENMTLKKIAKEVLFMDEGYLSKLFSRNTGEKFNNYLTKIRMEKAKKLIENGMDEKIYDVAQKVGFGANPQYFSQLFKKYTGCSPTDYNRKAL